MKTSQSGIDLIKQFEGCRLSAYKPVPTEKYYTIGYGHYGADVAPNMRITQAQADAYLVSDLKRFEDSVNATKLILTQNQFDALVSFTYNCGAGNLRKLVVNRTHMQIADALLSYNKGGGKVLAGLTRRRQAERKLFLTGITNNTVASNKNGCPYPEPTKNVKQGSRGNAVRWVQWMLNNANDAHLVIDGICKDKTIEQIKRFQKLKNLKVDGICGKKTRTALIINCMS